MREAVAAIIINLRVGILLARGFMPCQTDGIAVLNPSATLLQVLHMYPYRLENLYGTISTGPIIMLNCK
jgi:hypothetical protein